jgi:hypothetical protein
LRIFGRPLKFGRMARKLTLAFLKALDVARDSVFHISLATEISRRMLTAYRREGVDVNPRVARKLVAYLRQRARTLTEAADALERAAEHEEGR